MLVTDTTATKPCSAVLIVEDDPDIRESLYEIFDAQGFRVFTAEHGSAALDILGRLDERCLVILDLMMPVMNGVEFLEALEERPEANQHTVVVMSANLRMLRGARYRTVLKALPKPVGLDEIETLVGEYCRRPSGPLDA